MPTAKVDATAIGCGTCRDRGGEHNWNPASTADSGGRVRLWAWGLCAASEWRAWHGPAMAASDAVFGRRGPTQRGARSLPKGPLTKPQHLADATAAVTAVKDSELPPRLRTVHVKNFKPETSATVLREIFGLFGVVDSFVMGQAECWITYNSDADESDNPKDAKRARLHAADAHLPASLPQMQPAPAVQQQTRADAGADTISVVDSMDGGKPLASPARSSGENLRGDPARLERTRGASGENQGSAGTANGSY